MVVCARVHACVRACVGTARTDFHKQAGASTNRSYVARDTRTHRDASSHKHKHKHKHTHAHTRDQHTHTHTHTHTHKNTKDQRARAHTHTHTHTRDSDWDSGRCAQTTTTL